jgi:hypothetical protein
MYAITNPALGKKTDDASTFQSLDCGTDSFSIGAISFCGERIDRAQEKSHDWGPKKFRHRHPVDLSPHRQRYEEWIEMTDVIRGQQKPRLQRCSTAGRSAAAIRIFGPQHANTCDAAKQQSHHQPASAIRCRFDFHVASFSLL